MDFPYNLYSIHDGGGIMLIKNWGWSIDLIIIIFNIYYY